MYKRRQFSQEGGSSFLTKEGRLRDLYTVDSDKGEGVKNSENLAGVICNGPFYNNGKCGSSSE